MGSPLLTEQAQVQCPHSGRASLIGAPRARMGQGRQALLVQALPFPVTGCTSPLTCAAVRFVSAAGRVRSGGMAVLLASSAAVCTPHGGVPRIIATPARVQGA